MNDVCEVCFFFVLLDLPGTNHHTKDVKRVLDKFHELGVPVENELEGQSKCA